MCVRAHACICCVRVRHGSVGNDVTADTDCGLVMFMQKRMRLCGTESYGIRMCASASASACVCLCVRFESSKGLFHEEEHDLQRDSFVSIADNKDNCARAQARTHTRVRVCFVHVLFCVCPCSGGCSRLALINLLPAGRLLHLIPSVGGNPHFLGTDHPEANWLVWLVSSSQWLEASSRCDQVIQITQKLNGLFSLFLPLSGLRSRLAAIKLLGSPHKSRDFDYSYVLSLFLLPLARQQPAGRPHKGSHVQCPYLLLFLPLT